METILVIVDVYVHFDGPGVSVMVWRNKAFGLPVQLRFSLGTLA